MSGLKEIKNRITSVGSTIQITSAMKMVSAAKLKKAQDAITEMRPYANKMQEILQNVCATLEGDVGGAFIEEREVKKVLLVVISSNRGLCGAFNSAVVKEASKVIDSKYNNADVELYTIGKKANDLLSKQYNVVKNYSDLFDDLTFKNTSNIVQEIMDLFVAGDYDKVEIVYNRFKNAATTILTTEQMLPVVLPEGEGDQNSDYIFEPGKVEIVTNLIPKTLKTQLFKAVLDSVAAEHGSRMTAMHKATDNATDLKNELLLTYNKARQASITNEILEIVGGAEALNN
ncbi:ATP synthase gamma chain [Flavobacteriaceae bacterium UJ101]|nr:ATP synthase gamma chain [Flavobacteriaceae bacterium UJ101]